MDLVLKVFQGVAALVATLGLFGLAVYAGRRWGPSSLFQLRRTTDRRLQVIESLVLDAQRRLVLIRVDEEERLVLLGEGRVLESPAAASSRRAQPKSSAP